MSLLEVEGVRGGYGEVDILNGVNMRVEEGEIVVIIGPNGAGKSTAMKSVFGLVKIRQGQVRFQGHDITNLRPDRIVHHGMCYVPQENNVFPTLTVQENLEMGAFIRRDDYRPTMERIYDLFPVMREKRRQPAGSLSGGQRQMVAMGRALMLEPKLLLLDEPTAGLAPAIIDQMFQNIIKINELGVGILMVEQNAKQALAMSHRGYVLVQGRDRYTDTGAALLDNREVAEMFLGGGGHAE
ncbi:MAG: ABC transporter ATP-binding protein [Tistrella sp.]|jgi:branched-chain amino acid transport system ATP-binding protein|uniref:ABC transporter ATP-binding protein n=1 Tax=Tistrella mobilis TaxID=171437 RepID=A0A162KB71_9PROT|nr:MULTISPECIES: ABC transporter ATP-binding protein [Tistrella]KYO50849.1 ABC transporter ATP-binding protein [Tistrella mobilis]MAD39073.1 ABC transporter ATP-binding protein [Tistrella sp.]MBA74696.1 ABC transporter ATP-binding protein [Tistrella sp.]HAE49563.1 ABC transporter ATP-binding protein [Tistrella mobilis]|tara:strand:+ start:1571 stop:2290 length:720 start_codon:yes stop_codon:yes gene_type:complete